MFVNLRVKILDLSRSLNQWSVYRDYIDNQYSFSKEQIEEYQQKKVNQIFDFHYNNNLSYRGYVIQKGYTKKGKFNIKEVPILTKEYFWQNLESHSINRNAHMVRHTGGTTGQPLKFYLSRECASHFWPAIWRAFDTLGIGPCEKIMMIAGPSLFGNRSLSRRLYDVVSNFTILSAFDLNEKTLFKAHNILQKGRIKAIFGYTSAVFEFLKFLEEKQLHLDLSGIITTSENFIPTVRRLASEFCNCPVIDYYGANDGGVCAFECKEHSGYHLNFERCYVEINDGTIIVTDLLNMASPFIRYQLGDETSADNLVFDKCTCGRTLFRLPDISSRVFDIIKDVDGTSIHGAFIYNLLEKVLDVEQFQITDTKELIEINLRLRRGVTNFDTEKYRNIISRKFKKEFKIVLDQPIKILSNGKAPMIIRS